jgi:peptide/nickel transport system permease protein
MLSLIGRRLVLAVVTLFLISLIVFLGVEALPGDTATAYLGQMATDESLESLREDFGLNDPLYQRYLNWFGGILRGDLGESMVKRKPVVSRHPFSHRTRSNSGLDA